LPRSYNGVQQHTAPSSTITYRLSSLPSRPRCERACFGGSFFRSSECRFCWGSRGWCNCKKLQKRQEWSAEVWAGWGEGFGKGESTAIEEALSVDYLDCDNENDHYRHHGGENTADADAGSIFVDADADSFAGEDVTASGKSDDEDTGSWVSLDWEDVDADECCAESCCCSSSSISSISSISSSSSSSSISDISDSDSVDISSCDDTCSSDNDASIISASSIGGRRRM
jgi:hypothetical protein